MSPRKPPPTDPRHPDSGRSDGGDPADRGADRPSPADPACAPMRDLVLPYLDGELDGDMERRLENHLASCRSCTEFIEQHRRVDDLIQDWVLRTVPPARESAPADSPDGDLTAVDVAGRRTLRKIRQRLRRGRIRRGLTVAAAAGAVATISLLFFLWGPGSTTPQDVVGDSPGGDKAPSVKDPRWVRGDGVSPEQEEALIIENLDVLEDLYAESRGDGEDDVGLDLALLLVEEMAESEAVDPELFDYILEEEVYPDKL